MTHRRKLVLGIFCCAILAVFAGKSSAQAGLNVAAGPLLAAQESASPVWTFAISGDSRNCGDVVMPGIAAGVRQLSARFYWHLGDLRAIYNFDEDIQHQPDHLAKPLTITDYEDLAWNDFIQNQLLAFGNVPFFLAMGNHEVVPPKTRDQYLIQFADWLDSPVIRKQRLNDDGYDFKLRTYYHWIEDGVDFITLDNASPEQFDSHQMTWLERVLDADSANPQIRTIVAGMHEPLPDSISENHSMNQSAAGTQSGRRAYADLLKAQNTGNKHVYVLASHSHYFMDGIFNTDYWRAHGGILPGWIVGTAGAQRYPLPKESTSARAAETDVYGFLLGTVKANGEIDFTFHRLSEADIPQGIVSRYTPEFVHWCFSENSVAH